MSNRTQKYVSIPEAQLINWFDGQVNQLKFTHGIDVERLQLTFDKKEGYSILLEKNDTPVPVTPVNQNA
ncbi:hypothetical protein F889_01531 [Acinetobacter colistiniresistens]|uniref:Uncharacterized protein n=1 Tax=Acinetobacter colistiniresistens TaxID=280145 RepID=N9QXT3_9GAMM|nr:hypothetical protein [Acinetobacter colistiniresistens]ENX34891.1 hypothetical protein F889_01531 [Acinetobacter colistiniresistens]